MASQRVEDFCDSLFNIINSFVDGRSLLDPSQLTENYGSLNIEVEPSKNIAKNKRFVFFIIAGNKKKYSISIEDFKSFHHDLKLFIKDRNDLE